MIDHRYGTVLVLALAGAVDCGSAQQQGPIRDLALGDYTGDYRQSAVFLRDGSLWFTWDPANYLATSAILQTGGTTAMARLAGRGTDGRDEFLSTHAAGASISQFDSTANAFSASPVPMTGNWADSTHVAANEHATADLRLIAGIAADGVTIHAMTETLSGQLLGSSSFMVPGLQAIDIRCLDWDDATPATLQIAILAASGVHVFEPDGTPVDSVIQLTANAACTVIRDNVGDRLAWTREIGGNHVLAVRNGSHNVTQPIDSSSLNITGTPTTLGIASADHDGDGDGDLLMTFAQSTSLLLGLNDPVPQFQAIPFGTAGSTLACAARWFPAKPGALHALAFENNASSQELVYLRHVLATPPIPGPPVAFVSGAQWVGNELRLSFSDGIQGQATDVEVRLWHQPDPIPAVLNGQNTPLDPEIAGLAMKKLRPVGGPGPVAGNLFGPPLSIRVKVEEPRPGAFATMPAPHWPDRDHYYGEVRFLNTVLGRLLRVETIAFAISESPPPMSVNTRALEHNTRSNTQRLSFSPSFSGYEFGRIIVRTSRPTFRDFLGVPTTNR